MTLTADTHVYGDYIIEDGIPIPPIKSGKSRNGFTDAVRAMKLGQSVLMARKKQYQVHTLAERIGIKVVTRSVDKDVIRVWRIE